MNGHEKHLHNLRERKPTNPVARTAHENGSLHDHMPNGITSSGVSSGATTPLPPDALPSLVATSSARKERREEQKKRIFPTIKYEDRVSHFDPRSSHKDFSGFFVLFWIGLAIMVITTMLRNLKEIGYPLRISQKDTFTANIYELAFSDLLMSASTVLCLPMHIVFKDSRGILRWNKLGIWIQSAYQLVWMVFWTSWPFIRDWTWTAQVFFTLHLMALFMKMHSYAFYNGHLAVTLHRLNELDDPSPTTSQKAAVRYPSAGTRLVDIGKEMEHERSADRTSVGHLREDLARELVSPFGHVTYPQNLTLANYVDYLCCPTLCYEIEFPRTEKRSYMEIFYKTLAVFGCIFLLTIISEEYIIPALDESALALQQQHSFSDGALIFAETVSRLLFPFMITFLLVFLVIFEYLCGAFAEITGFADRKFYSDFWNSGDWLTFSKLWNIPVHNFFRRHVYSASLTTMSRPAATFITFLISSLAHELLMGCITRKFRGYGFVAMMLQMPIVLVQRMPAMRKRPLLLNVLFWCSMILGLSTMCALYVLV